MNNEFGDFHHTFTIIFMIIGRPIVIPKQQNLDCNLQLCTLNITAQTNCLRWILTRLLSVKLSPNIEMYEGRWQIWKPDSQHYLKIPPWIILALSRGFVTKLYYFIEQMETILNTLPVYSLLYRLVWFNSALSFPQ